MIEPNHTSISIKEPLIKQRNQTFEIKYNDLPIPVLKKISRSIESINAEEITAIAKTFAGAIMIFLEIDIDDVEPIHIKSSIWEGNGTFYTTSSPFFTKLFPFLIQIFNDIFTNSYLFTIQGTKLTIISSSEPQNALLGIIKKEFDLIIQQQIDSGIEKAIKKLNLSTLELTIGLSLNMTETFKNSHLEFDMHRIINGHKSTLSGISLEDFEEYVLREKSF